MDFANGCSSQGKAYDVDGLGIKDAAAFAVVGDVGSSQDVARPTMARDAIHQCFLVEALGATSEVVLALLPKLRPQREMSVHC